MSKRAEAVAYNERGNTCREAGNWQAAVELYEQAAALAPKWSSPHYNLGLLYKYQGQWEQSLASNQRAVKLAPKDEAAWWNLGIAATALSKWPVAREAWRGFGIDVPPGRGPLDLPCGFGPIRLNPHGDNTEVVWADRLCPARADIRNIPFSDSGFAWRDVVLNDGAPVGYRKYQGQELPVFDALQLLQPSAFGTFRVEVRMDYSDELMVELTDIAVEQGCYAENWTHSVRMLCRACSEGTPHEEHDHKAAPPAGVQLVAIAARNRREATTILKGWRAHPAQISTGELVQTVKPRA
ncbi:tetratricopeptide repeat protein [Limnoglobus roseus]|uniref:Tetratricopeptide repeat protein n=1 Tax=Limnoglobus roseus TaxID=2598579 RepID=A0A5C1ADA2_9BACT|nr:tetratricopeptide repeat protein [Limnoglobus roseus]QEL16193.1 tetratricopeptide repeat protein [Limnoglobus roseus]